MLPTLGHWTHASATTARSDDQYIPGLEKFVLEWNIQFSTGGMIRTEIRRVFDVNRPNTQFVKRVDHCCH